MENAIQEPAKAMKKNVAISSQEIGSGMEKLQPAGRRRERRAGSQFSPRASESVFDPLNWSTTKKDVAFATLCLAVATVDISKMMFMTINSLISTQFNTSYMAATALTGVPFIFSAVSGLGWEMLSMVVGKRGIYLGASILMLVGMFWNMHVPNYAQFMVSRIFQGIGWGAFESLVALSVKDMYFTHERRMRMNIYHTVRMGFTWGTPILSGYVSQSIDGFSNQIMIINVIQAISVAALIFAVPETSFNRSSPPPATARASYARFLSVTSFHAKPAKRQLFHPLKALSAPSALLLALLAIPFTATSLGLAATISLLFSSMPIFLFPSRIGYLFIGPLLLALLTYSLSMVSSLFTRPSFMRSIPPAIILGASGVISFGLYVVMNLAPNIVQSNSTIFALDTAGENLSLKLVSFLFGLLVAGSTLIAYSAQIYLSSVPTEAKPGSGIDGAKRMLEGILQGIFIIGFPGWTRMVVMSAEASAGLEGLRSTCVALGVLIIVMGSSIAMLFLVKSEMIKKRDDRVLGVGMEGEEEEDEGFSVGKMGSGDSFFGA